MILVAVLTSFTFPAGLVGARVNHLWRLALVGIVVVGIVLALRAVHPLIAALVGVPVYVALVLLSGAVARDDWDLIYRLVTAMPGGALIQRHWKRELT